MKNTKSTLLLAFSVALATSVGALADADHDHHKKTESGPNGGRLITNIEPHAEFFVTPERKVKITFVGDDGKVVPPADQVVTVTTGDRAAPVKLAFAKSEDALISDVAIPEGDMLPVVVQIKLTPSGKAEVTKFNLNMAMCPECDKLEYACTCTH